MKSSLHQRVRAHIVASWDKTVRTSPADPTHVRVAKPVSAVRCVPEGKDLPFQPAAGRVAFTLPILNGYQIIEVRE